MTAPVDSAPDALPTTPVYVVPDRADAPVSEVTERFLRAIVAEVPLARIEELHLFSSLRQGTVETGIAVIAARTPEPAVAVVALVDVAPELPLEDDRAEDAVAEDAVAEDAVAEDAVAEDAVAEDAVAEDAVTELVAEEAGDDECTTGEAASAAHDESVRSDEGADDEVVAASTEVPAPVVRHTVYTARYRSVIKGPERGKWEVNVKAEADAPLVTVETVVRGVQRRAGEESEIIRFTGGQVARALRM